MRSPIAKVAITALAATAAALCAVVMSSQAIAARTSPLSPPPPKGTGLPSGQCIRAHDIRNHTLADDRTVLINVGGKATYRVTVGGACLGGATSSDPIVTREPPGSQIICRPIDMDLAISKNGFESQCIVQSIVKMTPEELAALPPRLKP